MKVEFTKNGVFLNDGTKAKAGETYDLSEEEANLYLQRGWLKPLGNVKLVKVESEEPDELGERPEEDNQYPPDTPVGEVTDEILGS